MADQTNTKPAKKRQLKRSETVRQKVERSGEGVPRQHRARKTAGKLSLPLRVLGRGIAFVARPFAFVLLPFKTRPMRFIGRILASIFLFKFFRESWNELRQVQWPSAKETTRLTIAVFIFSLIFGVIIAVTDYGLDKVFKKVFID